MSYRLGIDTGGTFTDFVLVDDSTSTYHTLKMPSTPDAPSRSVVLGLDELAADLGLELSSLITDIELIVHGTTVATNAVLTGDGAATALVTTSGFRDALQMRRGMREETLNNKLAAPRPIVPRRLRFGATERTTFTGEEVVALDDDQLVEIAQRCREAGVEAVAICFLHSYANPEHERRARKILEASLPDVYLTTSHELIAQVRLYERVSTTVLNAYSGPLIDRYLRSLVASLEELGFAGRLLIMQSSGGLCSPQTARERAAATLLSGPAAAPVAGSAYAGAVSARNCLTIDMGGTSFDAALVPDGAPTMLPGGGWINRQRVALPMLAIHTIGAGGGSIASIDASGILRMGPRSAGAVPGPACYGHGGSQPTCTDADLVLGYLNPANFLGGRIRLDLDAAIASIDREIAAPLGIDVREAAAAMFQVINVNMTEGIREVSVDQGEDPRDFLLVVGGGAGPIHAGVIARELGIRELLVPRDSSVFAAVGLLLADVRHDAVRAMPVRLTDLDTDSFAAAIDELVGQVLTRMGHEGFGVEDVNIEPACDLRYVGQFHEITLPVSVAESRHGDVASVRARFHAEHERRYGWCSVGDELELVNLRVAARAQRTNPARRRIDAGDLDAAFLASREAYLPGADTFAPVSAYAGLRLGAGAVVRGPAIIELPTTTVVVPDSSDLTVTPTGDFLLRARPDDAG
jgi:N-methylhydantoinase A